MPKSARRISRRRPMRRRLRRRVWKRRSPRVKPDGMYKEKITIVTDVVTDTTGSAFVNINWFQRTPTPVPFANQNIYLDTNNQQWDQVSRLF